MGPGSGKSTKRVKETKGGEEEAAWVGKYLVEHALLLRRLLLLLLLAHHVLDLRLREVDDLVLSLLLALRAGSVASAEDSLFRATQATQEAHHCPLRAGSRASTPWVEH